MDFPLIIPFINIFHVCPTISHEGQKCLQLSAPQKLNIFQVHSSNGSRYFLITLLRSETSELFLSWKVQKPWKPNIQKFGSSALCLPSRAQKRFRPHLIRIDDDLALLLVTPSDEEHMVETGRVVQDGVVLERRQNVSRPKFSDLVTWSGGICI